MPFVVLVRHGIAVELGEQGAYTDAERMLTPEGRAKTEKAAEGFRKLGFIPDKVYCSKLVRAKETAAIFKETLGYGVQTESLPLLNPDGDPLAVMEHLQKNAARISFLFGHNPNMEHLVSLMLTKSGRVFNAFKKSGICGIYFQHNIEPGRGCLAWYLPPNVLRRMR